MKATNFSVMAVVVSLLVLAPMTRAQEKTDDEAKPKTPRRERGPRPQDQMKRIAEELKLTDEQKPKFEAAMKEQTAKVRELRQKTDLSAEDRRSQFRELRQDLAANMKKILEPEQFEKWEKMSQARLRNRAPRGERPPGKSPGEKAPDDKAAIEK